MTFIDINSCRSTSPPPASIVNIVNHCKLGTEKSQLQFKYNMKMTDTVHIQRCVFCYCSMPAFTTELLLFPQANISQKCNMQAYANKQTCRVKNVHPEYIFSTNRSAKSCRHPEGWNVSVIYECCGCIRIRGACRWDSVGWGGGGGGGSGSTVAIWNDSDSATMQDRKWKTDALYWMRDKCLIQNPRDWERDVLRFNVNLFNDAFYSLDCSASDDKTN
jgi:hypothetical protein